MQFNSESVECEEGHNMENIRSNQHNPEENNEVNYKWICELCTYQNWMAAKSCVMCHSKKHHMAQIISENNVNQGPSGRMVARKLSTPTIAEAATSDIFKLGTSGSPPASILSCSPPPNNPSSGKINSRSSSPASHYNNIAYYLAQQHLHQSGAAAASSSEAGGIGDQNEQYLLKWSCAQCTYLNLPKSPKCIQCLYSRKKTSPSISRNSPVSPRPAGNAQIGSGENSSMQHTFVHGINNSNNNNMHISAFSYRPQSTSPPPKSLNNLGATFENSLRINTSLEDSMSINERNRNNCSPPHSLIQNRKTVVNMQEKKTQYHTQTKEKNALLQNRVKSPPIISSGLSANTTSPTTSSSPPPLSTCTSKKWICQACTYENWPKSISCVICGSQRGKLTFIPENSRESTPPPEAGSSSQYENSTRNVRPIGQSQNRDSNSQVSPPMSARGVQSQRHINQADILTSTPTTSSAGSNQQNNCDYERRLLQLRRRLREADWSWLSACLGVAEGDMNPVEGYLNSGGDPTRKLITAEVALLNRPESFSAGHTLVHLAIKFHREDMLATLLSQFDGTRSSPASNVKCVPSYVAPDLASAIRRHILLSLRQRKGHFPCNYICEWATYSLPSEIEDLPPGTQEQLYNELMDRDAQKELEEDVEGRSNFSSRESNDQSLNSAINWSVEIRGRLGSRLYALWNRSAGDCLLDSVLQATWGVFDRDNTLRRAMAESLHEAGQIFYPRWKEWEIQQALELDYTLDESQLAEDWAGILSLASQPGASLEQIHIFCLSHVLRRPIIVYGVKYVKSWRGENLGYARFEGVYLPLLWERSFCTRSPIALGYTRGHFCALVPPEPVSAGTVGHGSGAGALLGASDPDYSSTILRFNATNVTTSNSGVVQQQPQSEEDTKSTYLPLVTSENRKQLLPIPYLTQDEAGNSEAILRQWLDVRVTDSGIIVAQQNQLKPPLLVEQLTEEWLNHYRKLAQTSFAPLNSRSMNNQQNYNYNNNMGCNNTMTSNIGGQSNLVARSTLRRASPTIPQHNNNTSVTSSSPIPAVSSTQPPTHTTLLDTVMPGQGIGNALISGSNGGNGTNSKGTASSNTPSNQVCYSSDGDSDEE